VFPRWSGSDSSNTWTHFIHLADFGSRNSLLHHFSLVLTHLLTRSPITHYTLLQNRWRVTPHAWSDTDPFCRPCLRLTIHHSERLRRIVRRVMAVLIVVVVVTMRCVFAFTCWTLNLVPTNHPHSASLLPSLDTRVMCGMIRFTQLLCTA
jgi:hypothetical protein